MRRDIDLHYISPEHEEIHIELDNWGRWSNPRSGGSSIQPIFRHYEPYAVPREPSNGSTVDVLSALRVQRAMIKLPEKNRHALAWCYVHPYISAGKMMRKLGVGMSALAHLVSQSRSMVKNLTKM